jgi:DNA-directed RNA polymerase specialized sigma24 family protein
MVIIFQEIGSLGGHRELTMRHDEDQGPWAFQQTQWSLVGLAAQPTSAQQREALGVLLMRYVPALRAHLRLDKRLPADRADDLVQGFISHKILEQRILRRTERSRGKFRRFLLRTLDNFVIDELRAGQVVGREAGLGGTDDGAVRRDAIDDAPDAAKAFEVAWGRAVLSEAATRMKQECEQSNRADIWSIFTGRVLGPILDNTEAVPYDELARQFGLASTEQASNVLMTAKRTFARKVREVVGEYAPADEVDGEVEELRAALASGK